MSHLGEYLEHVLPQADPNDFYLVMSKWTPPGETQPRFVHKAAKTLRDLENLIRFVGRNDDVWVAIQSYNQPAAVAVGQGGNWYKGVKRRRENTHFLQCLYADLDVKAGGYATPTEAADAVNAACVALSIPGPTLMVLSGSGLHCYWRLSEPLELGAWVPLAHALANALQQQGVKADFQCTRDSQRVLRPPETQNYKTDPPKPVELTQPLPEIPLAHMQSALAAYTGPRLVSGTGQLGAPPAASQGILANPLVQNFMAGSEAQAQPVQLDVIGEFGCAVLNDEYQSGGATADQPLWSLVAMACVFDETPWEMFEEMSNQHPGYVEADARQKLAEKTQARAMGAGWPSCQAFSMVSAKCKVCPSWGKITSPLNLMATIRHKKTVVQAAQDLPRGYYRRVNGSVYRFEKNGEGSDAERTVLDYPIGKGYVCEDTHELTFEATIGALGAKFVTVPHSVASPSEVGKCLSEFGIKITDSKKGFERARDFVMAWTTQLQLDRKNILSRQHYGWGEGSEFSYGDTTYSVSNPVPAHYRKEDRESYEAFWPKGDIQPWRDLTNFITAQKRPGLDAIIASAFAAPLVKLSGNQSVMLAAYSIDSGGGKSTAIEAAQAVWGAPTSMSHLTDTANALMAKVARTKNLPAYWDEIKTKSATEKLVELVFQLGQGREKARMNQNSTLRQAATFSTMMLACSNESIADLVTSGTDYTNAGAMRVFEIEIPKVPASASIALVNQMRGKLESHHGRAGEIYSAYLGANRGVLEVEIKALTDWLMSSLAAPVEERFWITTIACLLLGADKANRLGLTSIDTKALHAYLVDALLGMRERVAGTVRDMNRADDVEALIGELITDLRGKSLLETDYISGRGGRTQAQAKNMEQAVRLQDVWAQLAVDDEVLRVKRRPFDKWLRARYPDPRRVIRALEAHGAKVTQGEIGKSVMGYHAQSLMRDRAFDIDLARLKAATP